MTLQPQPLGRVSPSSEMQVCRKSKQCLKPNNHSEWHTFEPTDRHAWRIRGRRPGSPAQPPVNFSPKRQQGEHTYALDQTNQTKQVEAKAGDSGSTSFSTATLGAIPGSPAQRPIQNRMLKRDKRIRTTVHPQTGTRRAGQSPTRGIRAPVQSPDWDPGTGSIPKSLSLAPFSTNEPPTWAPATIEQRHTPQGA